MKREDIIRMAREAGFGDADDSGVWITDGYWDKELERFATLVIANHPPQSFMTWQEGCEAGKQAEREACAELRNMFHPIDGNGRQEMIDVMNRGLDEYQAAIRARGQA